MDRIKRQPAGRDPPMNRRWRSPRQAGERAQASPTRPVGTTCERLPSGLVGRLLVVPGGLRPGARSYTPARRALRERRSDPSRCRRRCDSEQVGRNHNARGIHRCFVRRRQRRGACWRLLPLRRSFSRGRSGDASCADVRLLAEFGATPSLWLLGATHGGRPRPRVAFAQAPTRGDIFDRPARVHKRLVCPPPSTA